MKKRFFVLAVAGLMGLCCLTACGDGNGDGPEIDPDGDITEEVSISFWGWGDLAEQENFQTLVNQFMAEPGNENINVDYTGRTSANHMNALNTSRNLPDLFMLPDYDFYQWAVDGKLKDITPYVTDEELSVIWPNAVEEYYYNADTKLLGKSEGAKLYGLPKDLGPFTFVYNATLLETAATAAGLDMATVRSTYLNPKKPMTFEQFRTLLKKLQPQLAKGKYALTHYELDALIYSNNANYFNDDASVQHITDKQFTDALQFAANLGIPAANGGDGVMTPESEADIDGFDRFINGNAIFSFMGPWDSAQFWKYNIPFTSEILPVPYGPGADGEYGTADDGRSTAWVGSMGYCISKKSSNAKTAAAIRLAKYLCMNENAQRKLYELGQQVPNIVEMAKDEYINDTKGLIAGKDPDDRSVWLDTIDGFSETDKVGGKVRARYYTYSNSWYDDLTAYFSDQGLWSGNKTAVAICSAYEKQFQKVLDDIRALI